MWTHGDLLMALSTCILSCQAAAAAQSCTDLVFVCIFLYFELNMGKKKHKEQKEYERLKKKLKKVTAKEQKDTMAEMQAMVTIPYYHPLILINCLFQL